MNRLCTGCAHYLPPGLSSPAQCMHEMNMNIVSGVPDDPPYILRKRGDKCGSVARWFEPGVHPERVWRRNQFAKASQEHAKRFAEAMVARAQDERLPDLYGLCVSREEFKRRMARTEVPNIRSIPSEWAE